MHWGCQREWCGVCKHCRDHVNLKIWLGKFVYWFLEPVYTPALNECSIDLLPASFSLYSGNGWENLNGPVDFAKSILFKHSFANRYNVIQMIKSKHLESLNVYYIYDIHLILITYRQINIILGQNLFSKNFWRKTMSKVCTILYP